MKQYRGISPAQKWARQRNWDKMRLFGVMATLKNIANSAHVVQNEEEWLDYLIYDLQTRILDIWELRNEESKNNFLKGSD